MMQDPEIHEIDIPRAAEDEHAAAEPTEADESGASATHPVRALAALRTPRRLKLFSLVFALVGAIAVGIAVAAHNLKHGGGTVSATAESVDADKLTAGEAGDTVGVSFLSVVSKPQAFFSVSYGKGGSTRFVISKKLWDKSFMVYPTIEKHSGPPQSGHERGSVMLETTDYVFHFEESMDGSTLLFVPENHRTRLQDDNDDLRRIFDDSQWPGYYAKVAIESETDDAYYIDSNIFLSSGFFVTNALSSELYTVIQTGSAFYPRNSVLRVEYELDDGIAIISYAIGLLPETVMDQRIADDRVGYFSTRYTLYGSESDRNATGTSVGDDEGFHFMDPEVTVLNRRRLEIDAKTKKTKEPIVFYIDPSVPERWWGAFVAGVEAWQPAFEAIGFKDAIRAVTPDDKDWPLDYRLGDLRYDTISVMISDSTYALGPSVIDPRSGEILHSDIIFEYGFFNEVMSDFDQHSPVDPPSASTASSSAPDASAITKAYGRLRQCGLGQHPHHKADRMLLAMATGSASYVSEELIGHHFTDIVMHEVGHTLGLRHNFAGTAMISRKQLGDDKFVAKNGLSTSIMDYIPVNIYSDLTRAEARTHGYYMTTIGAYDKAAIAYGYAVAEDEMPGSKSDTLTRLARAAPFFLTDEDVDMTASPYGQRFDLSDDPVDYANDRLDLAKQLRESHVLTKIPDDASWTVLWKREAALLRMINGTVDTVSAVLGGVNVSHAHRAKDEKKYEPAYVSKSEQRRALAVLSRIIRSEDGLFPAPQDYSTYISVRGYDGEDCSGPNLEYGCLARGLVDLDRVIYYIQQKALSQALFPTMERIVALDVNAPLKLTELLEAIRRATTAASDGSKRDGEAAETQEPSRNKVLRAFLADTLQGVVDSDGADVRIRDAILATFPTITKTNASSSNDAGSRKQSDGL